MCLHKSMLLELQQTGWIKCDRSHDTQLKSTLSLSTLVLLWRYCSQARVVLRKKCICKNSIWRVISTWKLCGNSWCYKNISTPSLVSPAKTVQVEQKMSLILDEPRIWIFNFLQQLCLWFLHRWWCITAGHNFRMVEREEWLVLFAAYHPVGLWELTALG